MSIGFWQIALIFMLVLIIFGAGKLPKVMSDIAKGIRSFREGLNGEEDVLPSSNFKRNASSLLVTSKKKKPMQAKREKSKTPNKKTKNIISKSAPSHSKKKV